MRQFIGLPFFPGSDQFPTYPLDRYLSAVPDGMISGWLKQCLIPNGLLVDPIGASPHLILETARAGYSILVTSNNPVISFMINILSKAPQKSDFQSALAELSFRKRGDERLDVHLRSLYGTECPACKTKIDTDYFLWKRDTPHPFAKKINCPYCGVQGEYPLSESDQSILDTIGKAPLHYARAVQKVKPETPQSQTAVESAVHLYNPRPLYFIFTLLNAIESAPLPGNQRDLLLALVLSLFDFANNLWAIPVSRNQPKILIVPPQFKETNLWLALEDAVKHWTGEPHALPVANFYPTQNIEGLLSSLSMNVGSGKIILFNGRMKSLSNHVQSLPAAATISVFPHPNQAFWTLCALWSAWLWGNEVASPLKWAFERQRFDWGWYSSALFSPLKIINKITPPKNPFLVFMPKYSPGLLAASLTATHAAGYALNSAAIQFEGSSAQLNFSIQKPEFLPIHPSFESVVHDQLVDVFNNTNEPLPYKKIHAAVLMALDEKMILANQFPEHPSESVSDLQKQVQKSITTPGFLKRYSQNKEMVEDALWFFNPDQASNTISISDQIEIECIRYLRNHPSSTLRQITRAMCELFPGLYTPSFSLIKTIIESYAVESRTPQTDTHNPQTYWQLNPSEDIQSRNNDMEIIRKNILEIGGKLGFSTDSEPILRWKNSQGNNTYFFHVISTAQLTPLLHSLHNPTNGTGVVIFPASRSRLIAQKLETNPYIRQQLEQNWKLVKFRLIRQIASRSALSLSSWMQMINQDPPLWDDARQLPIFS